MLVRRRHPPFFLLPSSPCAQGTPGRVAEWQSKQAYGWSSPAYRISYRLQLTLPFPHPSTAPRVRTITPTASRAVVSGVADRLWPPHGVRALTDSTQLDPYHEIGSCPTQEVTTALNVGDLAPDFELLTTGGRAVSLAGALKGGRPVLLVFLRHVG